MNFYFSLTLIVLFISSNTLHLVILFSYFICYTFYVSLFGSKISIRALLNVFCFIVGCILFQRFSFNVQIILQKKKSLACFCFRFFVFLLLFFEKINTPLCEDLYVNNSQFRNFIFGTIFGQPHIKIDYLWDFLTFIVIFISGATGHCFSVVEQVFKCW